MQPPQKRSEDIEPVDGSFCEGAERSSESEGEVSEGCAVKDHQPLESRPPAAKELPAQALEVSADEWRWASTGRRSIVILSQLFFEAFVF